MVQHEINLPEGWVLKQIKDVAPLQRGFDLPASKVVSGKYPVCYSNGIANYHNEFKAEGPGVFTGRSGTIGNVFYVKENYWPHNTSLWVTDFKGNDRKFVYYLYQQVKLDRFNAGTGVPTLNRNDVHVHKIPIPKSAVEQQKIASILSTWDKAIELKEKLIEQKKEQKKGLMQKLLTGEVRLPGFEDDWKEIRLGNYLIKHNEKSEYSDQYPVLTSSRRGIFLQKDYYLGNEVASNDNTGYNVVPYGFFTYRHMSDDLMFKFNINTIVEKGIVSTLYPVFTTKNLNSHFLLLKLNEGNEFKRFALKQKQGGSRTYMYFSKLEELIITVPSLEEQSSIAELVGNMEKQITLLETELYNLKEQKKGLMQLLLTGKVRVKV